MSTVSRPRRPKQRTFVITFAIDGTAYTVSPLECHAEIGSHALRFAKQNSDGAVYDLHCGQYGWACQCPGFEHYGYCKHVQTVQKAGQLFALAPIPTAPVARSLGDLARNHPEAYDRVTDAQLSEAMEHAPVDPPPTEEEVNAMARYFGQE
jgi:hypothetical protein